MDRANHAIACRRWLEYRFASCPPVGAPPTAFLLRWSMVTVAAVASVVLGAVLPQFEAYFLLFRTELPGVTRVALSASRWFTNDFGFALVWATVLLFPAWLERRRASWLERGGRRMRMSVTIVATLAVCGASIAVTALAWYLPQMTILQTVSSPGGPGSSP